MDAINKLTRFLKLVDPDLAYKVDWDVGYYALPPVGRHEYLGMHIPKLQKNDYVKCMAYLDYINAALGNDKPMDQICRELIDRIMSIAAKHSNPADLQEIQGLIDGKWKEIHSTLLPYSVIPEATRVVMLQEKLPLLPPTLTRHLVYYIDFIFFQCQSLI